AGTAAKFGAGGAAAAAANIDVGTAVMPNEDIAGTLAKSMLAEAAGSAAFGAGLHTAIAGLSKAFFNQKNPLFKTVFESDIPAAAQYIRTLNERVANGAEIGAENRAVLETITQTAKESGVDLDALAEGKIAPQYFAKVVRPWIQKIPYIGKMFPERMEGMRFVENKPLAGAKGEAFDAGAFRAKAAADVAASRPARREGLMLEAQTPGQREAIVASFPRTPDGDLPFHIDGSQTHFGSAKEFSEWLFAADSGARQIYDRFENLPERDTIWRDEWLPAFAVKYGAKIDGMNADGRTFSAARRAAAPRKIIDSIPDENVSDKLEAISAAEIEELSDAHLEYAARHGEEWASEEILRRAQESLNAGLEADDVWSRADAAGEKIPSPQALRESGSDLAAEMDAIYGALPDNIKKKYFSDSGGKLDETAQYLGYADENDLLDALAESARKFAEGGAPAAPKAAKTIEPNTPKRAAKAPKSAPDKSAAPKGGESLVRRIDEDRARIAKRLASTPEEIIADFYRDYDWVDKTLKDAKKSGSTGVGLQNPDRAPIRLVAYPKTGKFRVVSGANSNVLKKFDSEEQARAFLKKWILKAAEVAKVLDYAKADALGVFADKRGLSSEDAYVRDAVGEIKVDGVVMRAARNPDEVRESYRQWLEDERADAAADARQLELLQERNLEGGDEEAVFAESAGEADTKDIFNTPIEFIPVINSVVAEIENIEKNGFPTDSKSLEKKYAKYDADGNKILDLQIAKLNNKQVKYFGLDDEYVYTSMFDILDHHFNHHAELNKNIYFHLPNVIFNADKVAKGNVKDSYIFGKYLDKLHLTTNIISKENRKAVIYKNLFITSKGDKFFKNKEIIGELTPREDRPTSIQPTLRPQSNGGDGSISTLRDVNSLNLPSHNIYKSQVDFKSNIDNSKNDIYRDEAEGGKKKREVKITAKSDDPIPPDISGPRPGRFDARRLDETAHGKDYDADAADEAFADFLKNVAKTPFKRSAAEIAKLRESLAKTTEKLDPRMLELPELLSFAQNIANVNFSVVKKFRGTWLGVYWPGRKRIEIRADLFSLLGDLRRYDLAVESANKTLESAGYAPEALETLSNADRIKAINTNGLSGKYIETFQALQRRALREAKKSGTPVEAIGVAAHEIMHAIDDVRADGSRISDSGGTLAHIVGKVLPAAIRSINVLGGAELSPAMREHFRREARFAAGKRPQKKEDIKRWNEFVSKYYNERVDEFCRANGILTTDDAREELLEVIRWWQDTPVVGSYWADNPAELYAEAVSVFLLNNAKFRELAPRCYEAIMANIINRPNF
ncbi:MAG: hypothetical protein IJI37_01375, partial [Opitutales bacterium]|nr:hypothetical protein [Opitutales bacterium]